MWEENAGIFMCKHSYSQTYAIFTFAKVRQNLDFTQIGFECTCGLLRAVLQGEMPYLVSAVPMFIYIDITENNHIRRCRTAEKMT